MTEGWVDCPSLGPGWQRREVLRKNGTRLGYSDTYYQSPKGEKIRSRVELMRLLGCSRDLTDFDFKKGVFVELSAKPTPPLPPAGGGHRRTKKGKKRRLSSLVSSTFAPKEPPSLQGFEQPLEPDGEILAPNIASPAPVDVPIPKPRKRRYRKHRPPILAPGKIRGMTVQEASTGEVGVCCARCQGQFPGVMLPPSQRRCRWLCPDCRAERRTFNQEQRYYKQIGCGICQACQMSQDCGICRVCVVQAKSPEICIGIKCLLRRCLKIVKKGLQCGMCQACKITEDCGSCYICVRRQKPGMKRQWKCVKRRCLKRKKKISPKEAYSSKKLTVQEADSTAEDTFTPVRRRQKQPASSTDGPPSKAQRAPRRCHKRLSAPPPVSTDGPPSKAQLAPARRHRRHSATTRWKMNLPRDSGGPSTVRRRKKHLGTVKERKKSGHPPKHSTAKLKSPVQTSPSRRNRKCGDCEACLLKIDCGRCDFCQDKPKFGGRNLKRQKCRWRQCLYFAMKRLLPEEWSSPEAEGAAAAGWKVRRRRNAFDGRSHKPARIKQVGRRAAKGSGQKRQAKASFQLEEPDTTLPAVNHLIATSPQTKQDQTEPGGNQHPSSDTLVSAGLPQPKTARGAPGTEAVLLDEVEEDVMEQQEQMRPPVIMEIYSLGGVQPFAQLDSVLREFLAELNEIPLPAHWEVLPPLGGPDLRLVQRSKQSTMSAAVIHIRPGLFFHVVVQDLPVPQEHELYASHPARLTTVDEVVELIGDLEAYQLCLGWPAGWHAGERSQACDVLVYSGCCRQCRLNPWS